MNISPCSLTYPTLYQRLRGTLYICPSSSILHPSPPVSTCLHPSPPSSEVQMLTCVDCISVFKWLMNQLSEQISCPLPSSSPKLHISEQNIGLAKKFIRVFDTILPKTRTNFLTNPINVVIVTTKFWSGLLFSIR